MITLSFSESAGRFIVSTCPLSSNSNIYSAVPYSSVICEEWSGEVCWYCFKYEHGRRMKAKCPSTSKRCCKARYCSKECANKDWNESHQMSCELLCIFNKYIPPTNDQTFLPCKYERDIMRLIIITLSRRCLDLLNTSDITKNIHDRLLDVCPQSPTWHDVMRMQSNKAQVKESEEIPRYSRMYNHLIKVGIPIGILGTSADLMYDIVYREMGNSFGIWDTPSDKITEANELLGFAIYPLASYFNHSCAPNVQRTRQGRLMEFKTTADIPSLGIPLTVSYGFVDQPVTIRRQRLKENFFFECKCDKCLKELF